jgi:hypothetical protein
MHELFELDEDLLWKITMQQNAGKPQQNKALSIA